MRNILLILKNNLYRLKSDKVTLAIMLFITPIIIGLGIYFSNNTDFKGKIAIVDATNVQETAIKNAVGQEGNIKLEFLDEEVENTKLIRGEYVAQLNFIDGKIEISEFSNSEVKKSLEAMIDGKEYKSKNEEVSLVTKIVGFLVMFLFFGSITVADQFLTDRENKVYTRVLQGNVSYFEYTLGQLIYIISTLTIPTMLISLATVKILKVELGMSTLSFVGIIFLVGLLSGSFIILISNIFKNRTAVGMNGSIIAMLTCLLSGCLISTDGQNKIIDGIRNLLPQKRLLDFVNDFGSMDLMFVLGFIIIALGASIYIGNKDYKNGVFL
ncbi:MAG: ABC transporter permease [Sarcina sp.]